jgi:glycosyltransferase involved in cell wall biosynthesis
VKVLSLGSHDGFIELWLKQQEPGVEVDAIELHPHAVEECIRRGINCVQGAAEDAYRYFEQGTYDIVFAAELLEHVPDMDRLLTVCEQMIKPTGLVILTTPDGTFGAGNNPHHLRVLRSIDLAELLRRRGELYRMAVGVDGLTLAAYRPKPRRGEITIHTGAGWMRWAPQDIEQKGLGGSETAAVRLADALADLGWVVTVYGDVEQGCHSQVVYRHVESYDPLTPRDVLISSRQPELFDRPVNARVKLLWCHDATLGDRLTPERAAHIDKVLVLSAWQQREFEALYPILWRDMPRDYSSATTEGKIVRIRNGIDFEHYTTNGNGGKKIPRRQKRVVYASSPDRGLDVLLELWPAIRKRVPKAELAFAYAPVYFEIAEKDPVVGAHAQRIAQLSKQPGVTSLGSLSQPALAKLMRESLVVAIPSYNTPHNVPFYETSCITAMEAQAAGCAVVASNWGALPETVKVGALIDAEPLSPQWRDCFIEAVVRGLTNKDVQRDAQEKGPQAVADLGWGGVAEQITEIVEP